VPVRPPERMMNQSMVLLCSDSARNFVASEHIH